MEFKAVTIIVGATDENDALIKTVQGVMSTCRASDIEKLLIVKSKNSSEGCNNAIAALEKEFPGKVLGMTQIRPYVGGAIRDGFDTAVSSHIMLLPGDLGIGLEAVSQMLERAKIKPDGVVKISRWLKKDSFHNYSTARRLANKCAQLFLRLLFNSEVTDLTIPVQIMPTALYDSIDWQELNFPFLEEMVLVPLRLGVQFDEIPADCYGRYEGKSKNSVHQTALYLKTALRVRLSSKEKLLKR